MQNWDDIRFYLEVAKHGTVLRAAKSLGVSHATVLRRIGQLETELSVKLFKRLQSGYELTEAGTLLLPQAQAIAESIDTLANDFKGLDDRLQGLLRVSQPENDVLNLYPLYARFIKKYPDIQLEITPTTEVVNLSSQEADVAIRFTNKPHDLLVGHELAVPDYGAYASRAYLKQFSGKPALDDYEWLVWNEKDKTVEQSPQFHWLKKHIDNPNIVLQANNTSDLISAARSGIGVGIISNDIAPEYPGLVKIEGIEVKNEFRLWILTHRDLRNVARIKCFMRFIYDALKV